MIGGEYLPKPGQEQVAYDTLWKIASPLDTDLSGKDAVDFFRKSGVDGQVLKQIWGLSTPSATMNHSQFVTALRLITMIQNGDFPLSRDRLIKSADINYGPTSNYPKFPSLQQQQYHVPQSASTIPTVPRNTGHTPAALVSVSNNPEHQAYAITPADHAKYYTLFKGYDTNCDGYLSGGESVAILAQSGLDQIVLRAIWELADQDKDNQLSSKEFCVAFHLILCVSKKKLQLPLSLPPPLINFLKNAPLVPGTPVAGMDVGALTHSHTNVTASVPVATAAVPSLTIITSARRPSLNSSYSTHSSSTTPHVPESNANAYSSSHTTGNINILPLRSPPKTPKSSRSEYGGGASTMSDYEEVELTNQVTGMRDLSRRALQAGDIAVEANEINTGSLKLVLQRLAQEKIALTAAVSTAETQARESSAKLNDIVEEIKILETQCAELRRQVDDSRSNTSSTQGQISERTSEKQTLLQQISAVRSAIAAQSNDLNMVAIDVGKSEGQRAELDEREVFLQQEVKNTQMDIRNINHELVALQNILAALNGDKDARGAELTRLQSQKTASQTALGRQRSAIDKREQELEELKREKNELNDSRNHVINQVSTRIVNDGITSTSNNSSNSKDSNISAAIAAAPSKNTSSTTSSIIAAPIVSKSTSAPAFTIEKPSSSSSPSSNTVTGAPVNKTASALRASAETKIAFSSPPKILKKVPSKSSNSTPTSNKTVLIRTHSMNNKTGETDPFDDFTAKDNNIKGDRDSITNSNDLSPRDSKDNEVAVVVPFDTDFANTDDLFASFNNNNNTGESNNMNTSTSGGVASAKVTKPIDDSGFDSNPFENAEGSNSNTASPRVATATDKDSFIASSSTKAVHFTASTKVKSVGNKDDDGFNATTTTKTAGTAEIDDGFGTSSSGFDKNPFDDVVAFDAFGGGSNHNKSSNGRTNADGFGSASPFDAFGDEDNSTALVQSSSKASTSGFDEW